MKLSRGQIAGLGVMGVVAALLVLGAWRGRQDRTVVLWRPLTLIMGTEGNLTAVARPGQQAAAQAALDAGEAELRKVESLMNPRWETSEVSKLNAAPAGQIVPLSRPVLEVLRVAKQMAADSDGAFDVTCRPLLELRSRAAKDGRLPTDKELDEARRLVGWGLFRLDEQGAEKRKDGAGVDLGGIAKGYGIDRAVEAMRAAGCRGALVDVGGDVRCFGTHPSKEYWPVHVRDPFRPSGKEMFATLGVRDAAVCTSGNYFRYAEVGGRRHSHIVDPRTGQSADAAPSVTVVAPTATIADAWATALSVLGPEGLKRLDAGAGIEAMIVVGTPQRFGVHMTEGFRRLFVRPPRRAENPAAATEGTPNDG